MKENNSERHVREFLERQDFRVQRIATVPGQRRADYYVTDSDKSYVVEVKGKIGDEAYTENLLSRGEAFREEFLGRTNSISQDIREAAKQLVATPAEPEAFRIVAFVATGDAPYTQASQIESTLYGTVELLSPSSDGAGAVATACFYFTFSEFFNLRSVDAALIFIPDGSKVYVNNFSQRVREFRTTKLYQIHAGQGAVCDPEIIERQGAAFIADCDLDRREEPELIQYINQKYGVECIYTFKPTKYTAGKMVSSEKEN